MRLGTYEDLVHGCHSVSSRTNRYRCAAGDGVEWRKAFSELSSGSQSCHMVEPGSQPYLVEFIAPCVCHARASRSRIGRYNRTAARSEDQSQRDLPRSSAFQPQSFCESQWLALAESHVVGAHSVGAAGLGVALSHGVGTFGTVLPGQGSQTQETD